MNIIRIQTDYLTEPLGIDITNPRIRWNLQDVKKQTAYEIRYTVNGGTEKTGGIIESDSMFYDFKETFGSRDRVTFYVRALCDGTWVESDPHTFEMGLLKPSDWIAKWITGNYRPNKRTRYPVDCFRKSFQLSDVKRARLYISACGLYEATLNGQRVGEFVLAPGSTDYRKRVQYQTYDVTGMLKDGGNTLELLLADGWYRGSIGAKGMTCIFGTETAVIAQLEAEHSDGRKETVITDDSFRWSNDGELRFADLEDGEIVDKNRTSSYTGTAKITRRTVPLTASDNTFVREQETFRPVRTFMTPSGKKIYEFEQNLAGILFFYVDAKMGDEVHIRMGELLDADGELTLKNIQCVHKGKPTPLQEVHLICKDGRNDYHGRFTIAGFRYVEVDGDIDLRDLTQIALYSDLEETGDFSCDNELINILVRNTRWSLKSNSTDVPTDCPTRERMGWTGDSQVFFNTASYLTNYAPFARKHLVDVFDRQDKNGRLPQIAPYNAEDWFMDVMNGSVGWADVGVLIPWRYYEKYGDDRLLRRYYDDMVRYAKFMIRRCGPARGIYAIYAKPLRLSSENRKYGINNGQSYGEWAEPADVKAFVWTDFCAPNPEESMAYTVYILDLMLKISALLGRTENNALFTEYRDGIKRAYQELVTKEAHTLDTDRQAKLVRPLYMNLLTEEQTAFAKERLLKALENYGYRLGTGFLSTPFILDVLASYDIDACFRLLENEEMPGWLYMAKNSTGTIWEDWAGPSGKQAGIASLNHYSKGAVVEWLIAKMAGIQMDGENHFRIAPCVGGKEKTARATYQSVYGKVTSEWVLEDGTVSVCVTVPGNTSAEFVYGDVRKELMPGTHRFTV